MDGIRCSLGGGPFSVCSSFLIAFLSASHWQLHLPFISLTIPLWLVTKEAEDYFTSFPASLVFNLTYMLIPKFIAVLEVTFWLSILCKLGRYSSVLPKCYLAASSDEERYRFNWWPCSRHSEPINVQILLMGVSCSQELFGVITLHLIVSFSGKCIQSFFVKACMSNLTSSLHKYNMSLHFQRFN